MWHHFFATSSSYYKTAYYTSAPQKILSFEIKVVLLQTEIRQCGVEQR